MNRLLREHGFVAKLFDSGTALLDHGNFDKAICFVLDINLDGKSGIDLRQSWRPRAPRLRSSTSPAMTARRTALPRSHRGASPI